MHRSLLLSAAVLAAPLLLSAKEQQVTTKLEAVKVFLSGAQVTRTGHAELSAGQSTICFTGLSDEVDPASIQVNGTGAFTILGVRHQLDYLDEAPKKKEVTDLQARIKVLEHQWAEKDNAKAVLQSEQEFLQKNSQIAGEQQGITLQQLQTINDYMRDRLKAIRAGLLAIQDEQAAINEEATKLRAQVAQLQGEHTRPTSKVLVDVRAAAAVNATFTLEYVVRSAGWAPGYDVRVTTIDKPLQLTYKADVYQHTGEDWDNVKLTLSSGDPSQGGTMPRLQPWRIDYGYRPMTGTAVYKRRPFDASIREVRGIVRDAITGEPLPFVSVQLLDERNTMINAATTNTEGFYVIAIPEAGRKLKFTSVGHGGQVMPISSGSLNIALAAGGAELKDLSVLDSGSSYGAFAPASALWASGEGAGYLSNTAATTVLAPTVVEHATNFEFAIDEPYSIPSDGQNHHVGVQEEQLSATYRYYCTPKLDLDAFLFAKVTGWEGLDLLPGPMNIYFEGTYVGAGFLDLTSVGDTLDLSLGRDKGVVVQRVKQKAVSKRGFASGKRIQSVGWELAVRNTKSQAIELVITDQYPLAAREEIEVTLDEDNGAGVDKSSGFLTWKKRIEPRTNQKWTFAYSVKYPKEQVIVLE